MAERDPIINPKPSASASTSRSDKLNDGNRTKSVSHGGPNFSPSNQPKGSPPPNNPYRK